MKLRLGLGLWLQVVHMRKSSPKFVEILKPIGQLGPERPLPMK
jgi:hypothetical protein